MSDYTLLVKDDYGNKFYEIHENGKTIFDYTNNEVLKTNLFIYKIGCRFFTIYKFRWSDKSYFSLIY